MPYREPAESEPATPSRRTTWSERWWVTLTMHPALLTGLAYGGLITYPALRDATAMSWIGGVGGLGAAIVLGHYLTEESLLGNPRSALTGKKKALSDEDEAKLARLANCRTGALLALLFHVSVMTIGLMRLDGIFK